MFNENPHGLSIDVKITTNASKNVIISIDDEVIKIKIHAIAEKGKANKELIEFLSTILKWSKSCFTITRGATSSHKTIFIEKMTREYLLTHLPNKF